MKVANAKRAFESHLSSHGHTLGRLTLEQGLDAMLSFYSNERADDCVMENDGDMLLYQWGMYDWGKGEHFEVDITRQFICGAGEDDDISQLSLTFRFEPTASLRHIAKGNRWCHDPNQLEDFRAFIRTSEAYTNATTLKFLEASVQFEGV